MSEAVRFNEEIRSHLIYSGKVSQSPDWNFPSHKHDDLHEIVVVCDGEGVFTVDGKTYKVTKGDILVYNKGVLHEETSSKENPIVTYYCGFSFPKVAKSSEDCVIPINQKPVIQENSYFSKIETLIKMIYDESSVKKEGHERLCQQLLDSIIILLRRPNQKDYKTDKADANGLPRLIKEFIDLNYTQPLSLKDLAEQFHINPYYVSHVFKDAYNVSPITYCIRRRIGEATRLLVSTEMKVWEIGRILGYDNQNYFSILFKRITGQSPNQFRENNRKDLYQ